MTLLTLSGKRIFSLAQVYRFKDWNVTGDDLGIKAVGFDLFGTLVHATADGDVCLYGIYDCLHQDGLDATYETFLETYRATRKQQRQTRQAEHREVTNSETVCEAVRLLGYDVQPTSQIVREAVKAYFRPWELKLTDGALPTLEALHLEVKLGLVSNFTDVFFVEDSLEALGIHRFFDSVTISAGCGWRKPNPRIFQILLNDLDVMPGECLFVGDEVESDVKGAKEVGMLTALIAPNPVALNNAVGEADFILHSLNELLPILRMLP